MTDDKKLILILHADLADIPVGLREIFRASVREMAVELVMPAIRRNIADGLKEMTAKLVMEAAPPPPKKQPKPMPRKKKNVIRPRGQRQG